MKTMYLSTSLICSLFFLSVLYSCKKSSSGSGNDLSSISGNWQTTVWGGANDTARATITSSSAAAALTYLNSGALESKFSVNDVIYSNIKSMGNSVYSCKATYRYSSGGTNNTVGSTTAILTLENNNTVMYAHYAADASTSITPPDYYWYKQ